MPGFSIGGPIRRNRTSFFVNAQWLRAEQSGDTTRTVYTASARQGIWRYSLRDRNQPAGSASPSIDASGNPVVPFGTYNIPANDPQRLGMDPAIAAIIATTPLPNNFTTGDGLNTAGYTFPALEQERQMDFVTKVDHAFNQANTAFVRYSKGHQNTNCDQVNDGEPAFPGTTCFVNTRRNPHNWAANYRWSRAATVNELVVGQNYFTFDFLNPMADPSKLSFSAPVTLPEDFEVGNLRTVNTYQIVDNLSWLKGTHSFRVGTNMRFQRHTDIRGSVGGADVSPVANFSTSINTVDPETFGIPSNINTPFDRPALQSHINFLLAASAASRRASSSAGACTPPAARRSTSRRTTPSSISTRRIRGSRATT